MEALKNGYKGDSNARAKWAETFGSHSWDALFEKKFKEAEKVARVGLELDPQKIFIKTNLGHALLFQGKYDEALKVYKDYADDPPNRGIRTNVYVLLKDFDTLEEAGITHPDIEKVKKALQTKQ